MEEIHTLKEAMLAYIKQHPGCPFDELHKELEKEFEIAGDLAFFYHQEHILLWLGMSQEWFDATKELLTERAIYVQNIASPMILIATSTRIPQFPVATSWDRNYKHDHWMPVGLYPMTPEKEKEFAGHHELTPKKPKRKA